MRAATSVRSMPERRIAHAVSAMPPAPALANRRVAAWPARLIWVLAQRPMREPEPPSLATAENSTMWPRKESTSKTSASVSQRMSPLRIRSHASGRSAKAGASSTTETTSSDRRRHEEQRLARGDAAEREGVLGGRFGGCGDGDGHERNTRRPGSPAQGGIPPSAPCG